LDQIAEAYDTVPSTISSAIRHAARKHAKVMREMVPTVIRTLRGPATSLQHLQDAIVASHGETVPMDQIKALVARHVHGRLTNVPPRLPLHDSAAESKFKDDLDYLGPNDTRNIIWIGQAQAHVTLYNGNTKIKDSTSAVLPPGDLSNKYLITTAIVAMTFGDTVYDSTYFGLMPDHAPTEYDEDGTPVCNSALAVWSDLAKTVEKRHLLYSHQTPPLPTCIVVDEPVLDRFPELASYWTEHKCIFFKLPPHLQNLNPVHAYAEDVPPIVIRKDGADEQENIVQRHVLEHWDQVPAFFAEKMYRRMDAFRHRSDRQSAATASRPSHPEQEPPEMRNDEAPAEPERNPPSESGFSEGSHDHLPLRRSPERGSPTSRAPDPHASPASSSSSGCSEVEAPLRPAATSVSPRHPSAANSPSVTLSPSPRTAARPVGANPAAAAPTTAA
jgi:hypothetical protein